MCIQGISNVKCFDLTFFSACLDAWASAKFGSCSVVPSFGLFSVVQVVSLTAVPNTSFSKKSKRGVGGVGG